MSYRLLDMPDGNDSVKAYDDLMAQVRRGRIAGIVSIRHKEGYQGVYMVSSEGEVTTSNTFHACAKVISRAREAAKANGHEVLETWPTDRRS